MKEIRCSNQKISSIITKNNTKLQNSPLRVRKINFQLPANLSLNFQKQGEQSNFATALLNRNRGHCKPASFQPSSRYHIPQTNTPNNRHSLLKCSNSLFFSKEYMEEKMKPLKVLNRNQSQNWQKDEIQKDIGKVKMGKPFLDKFNKIKNRNIFGKNLQHKNNYAQQIIIEDGQLEQNKTSMFEPSALKIKNVYNITISNNKKKSKVVINTDFFSNNKTSSIYSIRSKKSVKSIKSIKSTKSIKSFKSSTNIKKVIFKEVQNTEATFILKKNYQRLIKDVEFTKEKMQQKMIRLEMRETKLKQYEKKMLCLNKQMDNNKNFGKVIQQYKQDQSLLFNSRNRSHKFCNNILQANKQKFNKILQQAHFDIKSMSFDFEASKNQQMLKNHIAYLIYSFKQQYESSFKEIQSMLQQYLGCYYKWCDSLIGKRKYLEESYKSYNFKALCFGQKLKKIIEQTTQKSFIQQSTLRQLSNLLQTYETFEKENKSLICLL